MFSAAEQPAPMRCACNKGSSGSGGIGGPFRGASPITISGGLSCVKYGKRQVVFVVVNSWMHGGTVTFRLDAFVIVAAVTASRYLVADSLHLFSRDFDVPYRHFVRVRESDFLVWTYSRWVIASDPGLVMQRVHAYMTFSRFGELVPVGHPNAQFHSRTQDQTLKRA
jgi:hypothetical protein